MQIWTETENFAPQTKDKNGRKIHEIRFGGDTSGQSWEIFKRVDEWLHEAWTEILSHFNLDPDSTEVIESTWYWDPYGLPTITLPISCKNAEIVLTMHPE
jgi:hypothetical protein